MLSASILICFWLLAAVSILFAAVLYVTADNLPNVFKDVFVYGKARDKQRRWTVVQLVEVPKKWFFHFYLAGVIVNTFVVYNTAIAYMLGQHPNQYLDTLVQFPAGSHSVDAGTAILLMLLLLCQVSRRLLECLCISSYSKSTINLAHYLIGLVFYTSFPLSVLSQAPDWHAYRVHDVPAEFKQWNHILALVVFAWASWQQHQIAKSFAQLRKNAQGELVDQRHYIPEGGWFRYVSCPHYFMEMLIYTSLFLATGCRHTTLLAVLVFVICNQGAAAYITHHWYLATYPTYPKNRKALIPLLF